MQKLTKALARTPLHHWHAARKARFTEQDGWQIPSSYGDVDREVACIRTGLGLVDLSAFVKISLRGRSLANLAEDLGADNAAFKPHGVAAFDAGGHVLACRLTENHLLLLALTTNAVLLNDRLESVRHKSQLTVSDVSCAQAAYGLLGASAGSVLCQLTSLDVGRSALPAGSCAETSLAGVHALLIRPPGTAVTSVYIAVAWDVGEYVWERLLRAGQFREVEPVGLDAWRRIASTDRTMSVG